MKKHCNIIGVGLAAAMLAACTAIDEDIDTSEVNVDSKPMLALSMRGGIRPTRMSDAVVQKGGTFAEFRGISDLYLYPFRKPGGGDSPITNGENEKSIGAVFIGVRSIPSSGNAGTIDAENHSKYYKDASVPLSTSAFLVYGKATDGTPASGVSNEAWNGTLETVGLDQPQSNTYPKNIGFNPVKIYNVMNGSTLATPEKATAIVTWLNEIYTAGGGDWANIGILNGVKEKFISMHAGSSRSVLPFISDLYNNIKDGAGNTAVDAVINKIKEQVDVDATPIAYKSGSTVSGYPADLSLPDGAAVINWSNNQFVVAMDNTNVGAINITDLSTYVYPPALWYYTNSHIHTSDVKYSSESDLNTIFNNPATWDGVTNSVLEQLYTAGTESNTFGTATGTKLFTANGSVVSTSTLVAVTKPLQYGVGHLEMTIQANETELPDGNTSNPRYITVGTTNFPITGVLIGSQRSVDYQFHPSASDTNSGSALFDSQISGVYMIKEGTPVACRTLALETKENEAVVICVELQNNSTQTFTGVSGQVIPPGCRFYLLGKLDLAATTGIAHPDPANPLTRVFEQDYVTKVTFKVSTLANAYNVIPDFTNPTIKFSLGVDDWKVSTASGAEMK